MVRALKPDYEFFSYAYYIVTAKNLHRKFASARIYSCRCALLITLESNGRHLRQSSSRLLRPLRAVSMAKVPTRRPYQSNNIALARSPVATD